MNKLNIVVIIAVLAVAGAFYGGMKYGQSKPVNGATAQSGANGRFGGGAGRTRGAGGGFTNGEIIKADDTSITLKLQDGGSKIVFVSPSAVITKQAAGSKSDLQIGQNVMVNGTANADGSLSANMVQLRPASAPGGPGMNGGNPAPSTNAGSATAAAGAGRGGRRAQATN